VLNQSDNRRQISRDVTAFVENKLGEKLLGVIHRDESVGEANASQQSVFDFSPASAAAFDIELIAKSRRHPRGKNGRRHGSHPSAYVGVLIPRRFPEKVPLILLVLAMVPVALLVIITPMDSQNSIFLVCSASVCCF
jgi:hypothetical protein